MIHDIEARFDDSWNDKPKENDAGNAKKKWKNGNDKLNEGNHQKCDTESDCDLFHFFLPRGRGAT
jgi:hypothetical protein